MMVSDPVNFREEAQKRGLSDPNYSSISAFRFDLNQGEITLPKATPERVRELVELARKHVEDAGYGEHNALLNLVALRSDLRAGLSIVYWHRSYYLNTKEATVSLRDWLSERGQAFTSE